MPLPGEEGGTSKLGTQILLPVLQAVSGYFPLSILTWWRTVHLLPPTGLLQACPQPDSSSFGDGVQWPFELYLCVDYQQLTARWFHQQPHFSEQQVVHLQCLHCSLPGY